MTKELLVRKIENGTVIDHVVAGRGLKIVEILGVKDKPAVLLMNVSSQKLKSKDVVKIEDRELTQEEIDKISLIAPYATINTIRDGEVADKKKVKIPNVIEKILKCPNSNCITNSGEPAKTKFIIQKDPLKLKCWHCERNFYIEEFKI
jgi:aspartate carbamoyltransferase regulatory subunit